MGAYLQLRVSFLGREQLEISMHFRTWTCFAGHISGSQFSHVHLETQGPEPPPDEPPPPLLCLEVQARDSAGLLNSVPHRIESVQTLLC